MQILNIYAKKIYEKDGEKKVQYYKAGVLKITDTGRKFIRFFHMPEHDFIVFDNDENTEKESTGEQP